MTMNDIHIAGTGLWYPNEVITNDEIVSSFNSYVDIFNADNKEQIESGEIKEVGNHDQLLKKRGFYYKLYQMQYKNISN